MKFWAPFDREMFKCHDDTAAERRYVVWREREAWNAFQEDRDEDPHLGLGEIISEVEVGTGREADVLTLLAIKIEALGIGIATIVEPASVIGATIISPA